MTDSEKARAIIEENIYMVLATASMEGEPWVSPVFYAYDDKYNFYWVSNKDSHHSTLLARNPRVAISIFNSHAVEGGGDGVYISARVEVLADKADLEKGMEVFNGRATMEDFKIKDVSAVSVAGVWRIYRAVPIEVSKLGPGTYIHGQYVDQRVVVHL